MTTYQPLWAAPKPLRHVGRATDALLLDDGEAPAAVLCRVRELESQLAIVQRDHDSLEHQLTASASNVAPTAAEAWQ